MLKNTAEKWGGIAQAFHWIGALLIGVLLAHGWWMTHMLARELRLPNYAWHADIGYLFLTLLVLRLLWRWVNRGPASPADSKPWERFVSRAGHWGLYLLMLGTSLAGWALAGTFRQPLNKMFGGLIQVPAIVSSQDRAIHGFFEGLHETMAWLLLALVALHVLAALRSQFFKRSNIIGRMLPFEQR